MFGARATFHCHIASWQFISPWLHWLNDCTPFCIFFIFRTPVGLYLPRVNNNNNNDKSTRDKVVVDPEYRDFLGRYSELYHRQLQHLTVATCSTHCQSAYGLHLEDNAVCVTVDLRLGCAVSNVHVVPQWNLSVNMRYRARKTSAEFSIMI